MRLASENAINLESVQTFFSEIAQPLALAKEKVNFPIFWCDCRSVGPNLASIWNFNVSNCYLPPSGSLRLQYFDLSQQLKSNRMENIQHPIICAQKYWLFCVSHVQKIMFEDFVHLLFFGRTVFCALLKSFQFRLHLAFCSWKYNCVLFIALYNS